MDLSKKIRNSEIAENAIAVRNAMNADAKEFQTFLNFYRDEEAEPEQPTPAKLADGRAALKRLFGGG